MKQFKEKLYSLLRKSERFFKTDMVYLVRNGLWINLNFVFVSVFSFILSIAFANLLSKTEYGTYQYILSLSALFAGFTFSGMNTAISQSVSRGYEGVLKKSIKPQLLWNLIPAIAAFLWSGYYFAQGNNTLAFGTLCICLSLPIINTFNSYSAFLVGKKAFKEQTIYSMVGSGAYYICMFIGIFVLPSGIFLLFINLLVTSASSFFIYLKVIKTFHPSTSTDPNISKYAYHLSFIGILGTIAAQIDNVLVFHYLGAADLAIYSIATLLPERLGGGFKFIGSSAFPRFAERSLTEIRHSMKRKLILLLCGTLLFIGIYIIALPPFFRLLYPHYLNVIPYSQLYALTLLSVLGNFLTTVFYAKKMVREIYILNTTIPIIQIIIQVGGIILWGMLGLVVAKIVSVIISGTFTLVLFYKDQRVTSI